MYVHKDAPEEDDPAAEEDEDDQMQWGYEGEEFEAEDNEGVNDSVQGHWEDAGAVYDDEGYAPLKIFLFLSFINNWKRKYIFYISKKDMNKALKDMKYSLDIQYFITFLQRSYIFIALSLTRKSFVLLSLAAPCLQRLAENCLSYLFTSLILSYLMYKRK